MDGFCHALRHRRVGMAKNDGAKAQPVVDIAIAIDIPDVSALSAFDNERFIPPITKIRVDAIGNVLLGFLKKLS
jgi:hypothetical protein